MCQMLNTVTRLIIKQKIKKTLQEKSVSFSVIFKKKTQKTDRTVQTLVIWFDAPM